jgi:hypothetical protein
MGDNYNFRYNVPDPSREDIEKHMDFDALLRTYQTQQQTTRRQGPSKLYYLSGILAIAAAAAIAGYFFFFQTGVALPTAKEAEATATAYFENQPCVNPPLINIEPVYSRHQIIAAQGGSIATSSGAHLVIPKMAFQNDRGSLIEGNVEILYREMHDAVDFFLAGVPMRYDSAGQRFQLAPVGMVEIIGMQDGKRIQMAPGKSIDVELVSTLEWEASANIAAFKIYHLDTAARNWVYTSMSAAAFEAENKTSNASTNTASNTVQTAFESKNPKPQAPVKPAQRNPNALTLELEEMHDAGLETDPATNEVLSKYGRNAIWQISPNSAAFDKKRLAESVDGFSLHDINGQEFELILTNTTGKLRLIVQPVLLGKDYQKAQSEYDAALAQYQKDLSDWESRLQTALQSKNTATPEANNSNTKRLRKVINRFSVSEFGIWNCDHPVPAERQSIRIGRVVDQNGAEYANQTAYLVNPDQQTLYQFHTGRGNAVFFNPEKNNYIWLVTPDQKIAILKAKQLRSNLELQVQSKVIKNEQDLREVLNWK